MVGSWEKSFSLHMAMRGMEHEPGPEYSLLNHDHEKRVPWDEAVPPAKPGELLQAARFREDLTQKQLAEIVGVTRSNISDMERGRRTITPDMAKRLAKALNTSYKNFL